jgi:hypothetical protein
LHEVHVSFPQFSVTIQHHGSPVERSHDEEEAEIMTSDIEAGMLVVVKIMLWRLACERVCCGLTIEDFVCPCFLLDVARIRTVAN